jgi:hypothetical protein
MMFGGLGTRGGQFGVKLFVSVLVDIYTSAVAPTCRQYNCPELQEM